MKLKKFQFGWKDDVSYEDVEISAFSVEHAIRAFKLQELEPECYVDKTFVESHEYVDDDEGHHYVFVLKPGLSAMISIFEDVPENHSQEKWSERWKKVGQVSLQECLNADFSDILPQRLQLPGIVIPEDTAAVASGERVGNMQRATMRTLMVEMRKKKNELELMRRELSDKLEAMRTELGQKMKVLLAIETFMGLREEIVTLKSGMNAPEIEPLYVHQLLLYMDEEIGIWKDDGIDFESLDVFDKWVVEHHERFMYHPKCIVAFKVRRNDKDYFKGEKGISAALANMQMNAGNHTTYFFIRNGENFYRIFSDIDLGETLFPTKEMYETLIERYKHYGSEKINKELRKSHESYMFGLAAIQGLIERTEIFGNEIRGRVNLFSGKFTDAQIRLVRDAEQGHWISDGRGGWSKFIKQNRATIVQGTRVVLTQLHNYFEKDSSWRTSPFHPSHTPSSDEIYIVEEKFEHTPHSYHEGDFLIRYKSEDMIYGATWRDDDHERKKRVPYRFYSEECINVDAITLEDCERFLHDRFERPHYLDILPILHFVSTVKKEEMAYEEEFVNLVMSRLKLEESARPVVRNAIMWWKLKNKWKRGLKADEPKALRMVERKVQGALK